MVLWNEEAKFEFSGLRGKPNLRFISLLTVREKTGTPREGESNMPKKQKDLNIYAVMSFQCTVSLLFSSHLQKHAVPVL